MTKHISCTETAALLRTHLKRQFPQTKFSVSKRPSGSSIRVNWTNGASQKEVESVCNRYEGARFDGMTDLKSYVHATDPITGEEIQYGADFIFPSRSYTRAALEPIVKAVCDEAGWPCWEITGTDDDRWIDTRSDMSKEWLRRAITQKLAEHSFEVKK